MLPEGWDYIQRVGPLPVLWQQMRKVYMLIQFKLSCLSPCSLAVKSNPHLKEVKKERKKNIWTDFAFCAFYMYYVIMKAPVAFYEYQAFTSLCML